MRRKKRLLFDVLDDMIEPRDRYDRPARSSGGRATAAKGKKKAKQPRRPEKKAPPRPRGRAPGEGIRLSYGMAGAVLLVLLGLVGISYRFGFDHGEGGVFSREEGEIPSLPEGGRDLERDHFAVRAASIDYARGGFESAAQLAQEYVDFLLDCGYVDAVGVPVANPKRAGWGKIIIWAGQARARDELAADAERIRSLTFRGTSPFVAAYPELFSRPK